VSGFVTREIRDGARRVGFGIETPQGKGGVLAHVDFAGPPRVGKYGVDLEAFEAIALPALARAPDDGVTVIDELGKMELASERFRHAVAGLFERRLAVVATVHAHRHPFTDELKRRDDVAREHVTARNRDALPERLAARLT
jgi:nucleoside-triphosphatase